MELVMKSPIREQKAVSDGVVGMIFLLATEAMFFAGLISAYIVNRAGALMWPPYGQPRLPVEVTAVNTAVLIGSAGLFFLFKRRLNRGQSSLKLLAASMALGSVFVIVQGTEWVKLMEYGLTTTSSLYGAFFYTLIGAHALHAVAGLVVLIYLYTIFKSGTLLPTQLRNKSTVCGMYWYFVVGIWPVLYYLVYLLLQ